MVAGARGRRWSVTAVVLALGAVLAGGALVARRPDDGGAVRARLALDETLGGVDTSGFARATAPRTFAFPADHGPHPEFRTEWWYYTGNLDAPDGRHFGFQVTFFRRALTARPVARGSAWGASQVYLAHFAVTDVAAGRFHASERVSREALGLAGASGAPFRVWVEDWSVEDTGGSSSAMRLRAAEEGIALDLRLEPAKPPVLQGERGLSRKSAEPGNASYYYSLSRLLARGTLAVGGREVPVRGLAWMDREWSTSALAPDQVGWDWFALQLGDGRELMLYRLRRRDGSVDPASRGVLIGAGGRARPLGADVARVEVLEHWRSPRDGARYPSRWRLRVPDEALELEVTPHLADQELALAVRYWEGAVRVRGTSGGAAVSGHGYVELTGYAGAGASVRE